MRHTVAEAAELLEVLQRMQPDASRNALRRMLDKGTVFVDGARERRAKRVVPAGAVVEVRARPQKQDDKGTGLGGGVRVLYEDDVVLVAEKPHGLLTIATDRGEKNTLYDRLFERAKTEDRGGRIFIVHRLDRPTSGLMLFAKNEEAKDLLQEAFAKRDVERVYHVLVEGVIADDEGTIKARLGRSKSLQVYVTPSPKHGKEAITHWRVLERGRRDTLVEVTLGTGKRHQIRAHMAHLGHPVVGDKEHGARSDPLKRLGLHAHRLVFPHPVTGERVRVESPTPPAFRGLVRRAAHDEPDDADPQTGGAATR